MEHNNVKIFYSEKLGTDYLWFPHREKIAVYLLPKKPVLCRKFLLSETRHSQTNKKACEATQKIKRQHLIAHAFSLSHKLHLIVAHNLRRFRLIVLSKNFSNYSREGARLSRKHLLKLHNLETQ